ncbi:class I SAM-dependent methyltransferase [Sphingomonas sp. R-74633]|uniref:class I SAM-dependent methyltransferase n=1 Tax=Sphingomonas sp. R-74633 TaxID=2751188 RepID=UPI0015D24B01|nr:class I SAM-dependent methyltransferase [Sphingomonas sp. R-74633]
MQAETAQLLGMAEEAVRQGQLGQALPMLSRALAFDPEGAAPAYAELLARLSLSGWPPQLEDDLVTCLHTASVDPQALARGAARMLLVKYPEPVVADDALWEAFLTRCINVDPAMERRLVWLAGQELPRALRTALAVQAFASEYVWGGEGLSIPPAVAAEIAEERTLAAAMPSLGDSGDQISRAVRDQYEASPYPRWRAPPVPQRVSVAAHLAALGAPQSEPLELLVAGCGTGFEPIDMARMDPSLRITALDLSAASLAYGQRMARERGVENLRFVQGDILDSDKLGGRFGMVSSTGVLHHMERPENGLSALAGVLKPGGVLRIALYSERARAWVSEAHDAIAAHGWDASPKGIRAFRAHVLALPAGTPLARLRESDDFYTLSGCRDLCFHVREHWYRLPAIGEMLTGAGLALLMLDAPPEAQARFAAMHGDADRRDLALWDRVEAAHPHLFAGMFHLWARRP